ncbi:alpha/beta hydrolase [Hymenobacter norwichensis]|uniref:alpha/beta hydrolase n=1 Tax=Hymenobacter norwichensis TaxID=223903 RepID=UPI0003B4AF55|nr:phospholipase [Hymenobacter norwichensis]
MLAHEHHLVVSRTARYFQLGELSKHTQQVWVVCHGYGQLAEYFIRHFAALVAPDPTLVVVAPEGLSRFYLENNTNGRGRIGATWMTREDRHAEIEDYTNYLNQLASHIFATTTTNVGVTVLGFSQGAATVSRWLTRAQFKPRRLVLWAGVFPPDMELPVAAHLLQNLPVTLVAGTEDPFVGPEKLAAQQEYLTSLGVGLDVLRFNGKHALHADTLRQIYTNDTRTDSLA